MVNVDEIAERLVSVVQTRLPRTCFCFELCYPAVVQDALGDTLVFDLELTLQSR